MKKIEGFCVISACRIIGPVFYAARYINDILSPFFPELMED
jgi:hypothetical protein